jgi:uncharacterized membrane protein
MDSEKYSVSVLWIPITLKTDSHDIAEILLKMALNTITLTLGAQWIGSNMTGTLRHNELCKEIIIRQNTVGLGL